MPAPEPTSSTARGFNVAMIAIVPPLQFLKFYFLWLGFLDGREGLVLNACYALHLSWKYIKAWEMSRGRMAVPAKRTREIL